MTFYGFVLCCKISREIHGNDSALRHTVSACRDKVKREHRPLLSRIMRHPKISLWLDGYTDF